MRTILVLLTLLLFTACSGNGASSRHSEMKRWMEKNGKIKVLATTAMIDDMVQQIGNGYVDSLVLITGQLDPHSYQLVKGDDEKFAFADVIFYNGLGLEHGPSLHYHLQNSRKAIGLGDLVLEASPDLILHYNNQLDPHIWMDMSMWARIIPFIVQKLSEQDPVHAQTFRENGDALVAHLLERHGEIREKMLAIPESQRYLVTSHDAFNYFARAYLAEDREIQKNSWQKRFAAPEGLAPDSQLSATDIQQIIDHLQKYRIHVLFPESNVSKDSIRKIVEAGKSKGMELTIATEPLYADAMGQPGSDGDTYEKMLMHNTKTISYYLKNNFPK